MNSDKTNSTHFGVPPKENVYEKYIGKEYILRPIGANDSFVGKIKGIDSEKGKITLNPYLGISYSKMIGKNLYKLIRGDYDLFTDLTKISFEPTNKESIIYNCRSNNNLQEGKNNPVQEKNHENKPEKISLADRIKLVYTILFNKDK